MNKNVNIENVNSDLGSSESFDVLKQLGNVFEELSKIAESNGIVIEIDNLSTNKNCTIKTLTLRENNNIK